MHKKGYTLIELLAVISIMLIIGSLSLKGYNSYKKRILKANIESCSNSIMMLINSSKNYCYNNKTTGKIEYFLTENKIKFKDENLNNKVIYDYKFPKDFNIYGTFTKINIKENGHSSDACTIKYKDSEGGLHSLTLIVGTSYVEIKN